MSHRKPAFKISNAVPSGIEHSPAKTMLKALPRLFCDASPSCAADENRSSVERGTQGIRHKLRGGCSSMPYMKRCAVLLAYRSIVASRVAMFSLRECAQKKLPSLVKTCAFGSPSKQSHPACAAPRPTSSTTCRATRDAAAPPAGQILRLRGDGKPAKSSAAPPAARCAICCATQRQSTSELHLPSAAASARSTADDAQLGSLELMIGS